jgi:hypothetical protein
MSFYICTGQDPTPFLKHPLRFVIVYFFWIHKKIKNWNSLKFLIPLNYLRRVAYGDRNWI